MNGDRRNLLAAIPVVIAGSVAGCNAAASESEEDAARNTQRIDLGDRSKTFSEIRIENQVLYVSLQRRASIRGLGIGEIHLTMPSGTIFFHAVNEDIRTIGQATTAERFEAGEIDVIAVSKGATEEGYHPVEVANISVSITESWCSDPQFGVEFHGVETRFPDE